MSDQGGTADFLAGIILFLLICGVVVAYQSSERIEQDFKDYGCEDYDINTFWQEGFCQINGTWIELEYVNDYLTHLERGCYIQEMENKEGNE